MISSFKDKDARTLYETGARRRFGAVVRVALRKLDMIAAAAAVETLRVPPWNRLEKLSGKREGQWSIRINEQWRVCFKMEPQLWLNLQSNYDLAVAEAGVWGKIKRRIPEFIPSRAAAAR